MSNLISSDIMEYVKLISMGSGHINDNTFLCYCFVLTTMTKKGDTIPKYTTCKLVVKSWLEDKELIALGNAKIKRVTELAHHTLAKKQGN